MGPPGPKGEKVQVFHFIDLFPPCNPFYLGSHLKEGQNSKLSDI